MELHRLKHTFIETLLPIYADQQEIESFFFILTEHLHQMKRIDVALHPDFKLSNDYLAKWMEIIQQLKEEKPIQYIVGEAWFYGLRFEVNENTLIPRPETEELVAWILNSPITHHPSSITILDIGTGTGCIPISLKTNLPQAKVSAIDVSEKAVQVAKRNAKFNEVEINFIQANILEVEDLSKLSTSNFQLSTNFDIIVSNPPYVRHLEKTEIKKNVVDYEPHLALFVDDSDALLFYRKIAQLALLNLAPNGFLFFEINQYLGKETVELMGDLGFKNIELRKDIYGNDRMIRCEKN
jgi:release factor glutamine methyltransferase